MNGPSEDRQDLELRTPSPPNGRKGYAARARLSSTMKNTLPRRLLGTLLSAALGFIVGFVLTVGIGEPIWWLGAGILGAAFCGGYAALFGTPWMHESSRRAI